MQINRFIAIGDSITEGLSDRLPNNQYRGWADRVADELCKHTSNFQYANFAVRGRLLKQIVDEQVSQAVKLATGVDTLISFHAGANNILRPQLNLLEVTELYESAVAALSETNSQIVLFTIREIHSPKNFLQRKWNERFIPFNDNVRKVSAKYGTLLIDANKWNVLGDPRMLAADRLHLSSEGHRRMAAGVLNSLDLPHDNDWLDPLPPMKRKIALLETTQTFGWALLFLVPWVIRRILRRSSGTNRQPKYPELTTWPLR